MWKCRVSAPALTIGHNRATMAKYRFILEAIIPHSQSNGNAWFGKLTTSGSTSPSTLRQAQGRLGSGQAHHKRFGRRFDGAPPCCMAGLSLWFSRSGHKQKSENSHSHSDDKYGDQRDRQSLIFGVSFFLACFSITLPSEGQRLQAQPAQYLAALCGCQQWPHPVKIP